MKNFRQLFLVAQIVTAVFLLIGFQTPSFAAQLVSRLDSLPKQAYPFMLKDPGGRLVRASDFKGKLMVIEFWFTGCVPCIALAKSITPVIEHFENNDDVVFVSINLDADKEKWLNSLLYGGRLYNQQVAYVHPNAISLATYPYGFNHPIATYYHIQGAPQLIIIGKEGEILNRNPPRPNFSKEETIDDFTSLIESYLSIDKQATQ